MSFRPWPLLVASVALLGACGAGDAPPTDEASALAIVPSTGPRSQRETGDCWLYATAAWVESLEYASAQATNAHATAPPHIAIAYWNYWSWYEKITSDAVRATTATGVSNELDSGGSWGDAVELTLRRGIVRAEDFVGDGVASDAIRSTKALSVIVESLMTGPLSSKRARKDGALVRRELERALRVRAQTSAALTTVFGVDGSLTLDAGAVPTGVVLDPASIVVAIPRIDGPPVMRPLADAIGRRASPGDSADRRAGQYAWSQAVFRATSATTIRAYMRRLQRVLHAGAPVPMSWLWASNADPDATGRFTNVPDAPADAAESVDHETLLVDYEVHDVPGFGDSLAGVAASPAAKEAALDESAKIVFLRVKDSYWDYRGKRSDRVGFTDLYLDYLLGEVKMCPKGASAGSAKCTTTRPLEDAVLPAGF